MSLSPNEEYLEDAYARQGELLRHTREQLTHANESVQILETVIHKAAQIAQHLPYLCESLPEPSNELMQAALQLQTILVQRKV